jgi:L-threonylcarbamoyladenylate synthase
MKHRWKIDETPSAAQLREIADVLVRRGVVLMPTDTIYGLHALANDANAIANLASLKSRDEKPFVVIANSLAQIDALGVILSPSNRNVLQTLWPAPLTAVAALRASIAASRGAKSIAVRIPDLVWLRELLAITGPLASTSANRSGEPHVSQPDDLAREILDALDGVVDRGPSAGNPSAIVDFTSDHPQVIRAGEESFTQKLRKTLRKSL